jgi:hypothetical protein
LQEELAPIGLNIESPKQVVQLSQKGTIFVKLLKLRVPDQINEQELEAVRYINSF